MRSRATRIDPRRERSPAGPFCFMLSREPSIRSPDRNSEFLARTIGSTSRSGPKPIRRPKGEAPKCGITSTMQLHRYLISGLSVASQMELPGAIGILPHGEQADITVRFERVPEALHRATASGPT